MGYDEWYKKLEKQFIVEYGISPSDLPDQCYHAYWEDQMTAEEAVEIVYEEALIDLG